MQTVWLVLTALMTLLNVLCVYLGVIFFFTFKKRKAYPKAAPDTRFAVIIPARNEGQVIGNLIDALKKQDYPADKIDIYVAVNNTTDDTEAVAMAAGAKILRSVGAIACKGDALHQAVEQLLPMDYDAFAIFDADNVPDREFMQHMNDALAAGERVCKGRLKAGNAFESWVSGSYGLYHALMELSYSRPHSAAGFSSNLVGTAFVAHREVLEKMGGWNTFTMCEDTEFAAQSTRLGYRVAWVHDALSYDEQVEDFIVSLRQRHRWCYGMVQCARSMTRSMFSKECPKRGMAWDFGMLFIISHTAPTGFLLMLLSMPFQPKIMWLMMAACLVLAYFAMVGVAIFLCWYGGYPVRRMWKTIWMFPIFMASWGPLQLLALIVPVKSWSVIQHSGQKEAKV